MRNKVALIQKTAPCQALDFIKGKSRYVGAIDELKHETVRGWVGCVEDPSPVCVKVTKGREVKIVLANEPRADVVAKGKLKSKFCGFTAEFSVDNHGVVQVDIMVQAKPLIPTIPDYRGRKLFFVHIPKAAGSSVNDLLSAALSGEVTYTHIEGMREQWQEIAGSRLLSGHVRYPEYVKAFSDKDFVVFAFLREPYAHLRSHLNWVRRLVEPELTEFRGGHSKIIQSIADGLATVDFTKISSLEAYVRNIKGGGGLGLFDNCQVRYLSSVNPNERVEEKHLKEAIFNLKQLHFVGICEESKASQSMLAKLVNLEYSETEQRSNVNTYDYGMNINSASIRNTLGPLVKFDIQLYEVALELFKQQKMIFKV